MTFKGELERDDIQIENENGWPEFRYESMCRSVLGFNTAKSINNNEKVEQVVSNKMGSNPRVVLLNRDFKETNKLHPRETGKTSNVPMKFEEFAGVAYTDDRFDDFSRRIRTDGLITSDTVRSRARNDLTIDLIRDSAKSGKKSYVFTSDDRWDHVGHHLYLEGGHSVRFPVQMKYMQLFDKMAAQIEAEIPKGTLILRYSDHAGDVYGGYSHYHDNMSSHGQKNTFTQRTGFFSVNYSGGAKKIGRESIIQMPTVYDIPIIEASAFGKRVELEGSEVMTLAGELSVDLSPNQMLSQDTDYIYSPNYIPKTEQEMLYKFYVKTIRTPTLESVMEPGDESAIMKSKRGREAVRQSEGYREDMKKTESYQLLTADKNLLQKRKLQMINFMTEQMDKGKFQNLSDRDLRFLYDLARVEGLADVKGMKVMGWVHGSGKHGELIERDIVRRLKRIMDSTTLGLIDRINFTEQSYTVPSGLADTGILLDQHPMFRSQAETAKKWRGEKGMSKETVDYFRDSNSFPDPKVSVLSKILVDDNCLYWQSERGAEVRRQINEELDKIQVLEKTDGYQEAFQGVMNQMVGTCEGDICGMDGTLSLGKFFQDKEGMISADALALMGKMVEVEEGDSPNRAEFVNNMLRLHVKTKPFAHEVASQFLQRVIKERTKIVLKEKYPLTY